MDANEKAKLQSAKQWMVDALSPEGAWGLGPKFTQRGHEFEFERTTPEWIAKLPCVTRVNDHTIRVTDADAFERAMWNAGLEG